MQKMFNPSCLRYLYTIISQIVEYSILIPFVIFSTKNVLLLILEYITDYYLKNADYLKSKMEILAPEEGNKKN